MRRLRSRASFDYTKQENTPTKSWNPLRRFNVAAACIGFAILLAFLSLISEVAEVIEKEKLPFQVRKEQVTMSVFFLNFFNFVRLLA